MTKGTFFRNHGLIMAAIVIAIIAMAIYASSQGGIAVEFGGLEMTLATIDGALNLSVVEAAP